MLTYVNYYLIVIDLSYVTVWLMWIKINEMNQWRLFAVGPSEFRKIEFLYPAIRIIEEV
jgi:hypothetical protein